MICKQLQIEPVTKYVVGSGPYREYLDACHRLIYVLNKLSGNCLIVPYRKIKSYVKVAFQDPLTSSGL